MPANIQHIVIQWPRFGPYHVARIEGLYGAVTPEGVRVTALETASGKEGRYAWTSAALPQGVAHVDVLQGRTLEDVVARQVFAQTYAALDRLDPDVVGINSYSQADAWACLCWCRDHHRVAVLMTESKADDVARTGWREMLKRQIVRQFDSGLVGGNAHREYMARLGLPAEFVRLGYDVVDNGYYARSADEARRQGVSVEIESPFFLCVSQFIARKGVDVLIRAYARYRALSGPDAWPLVIIGDGPDAATLHRLIEMLAVPDVFLAGTRPPEALPHYYALAGALVHPAQQDQWGLVVNEAMATGLPVVSSDGAGSTLELVEEGINGFRVRAGDDEHFALTMLRMASPETDRAEMGRRAQEAVAAWTPERFGRAFWEAAQLGRARADRSMPYALRLGMNTILRLLPRLQMLHQMD